MKELYGQVDFIVSGGALKSLSDFLASRVKSAVIVTPVNADLDILDAVGEPIPTDELILRGRAPKLISAFPTRPLTTKFGVDQAELERNWLWAVRIRGLHWAIYIVLRERPDEALLAELAPYAGLIYLWQAYQQIDTTEKRLASLSYMILATKSTLASIFEPMPIGYYATFLADVLRESLFPKSLAIFQDDGKEFVFLEGNQRTPPKREGLYAQKILPPVPVVTRESAPYEVVLPIVDPCGLFCVLEWDALPAEEALNFLELIGNLASRALSVNLLTTENLDEKKKLSSGEFTMLSLFGALDALKKQEDRAKFLTLAADIFMEFAHVSESFLVLWNEEQKGYVPVEYRKDGVPCAFDASLSSPGPVPLSPEASFTAEKFSQLLPCPWPEMAQMRRVLPFWGHDRLEGFAALSEELIPLDSNKLSGLQVLAQFVVFDLKRFVK